MIKKVESPSFFDFKYFTILFKFILFGRIKTEHKWTLKSFSSLFILVCFFVGIIPSYRWLWVISLTWIYYCLFCYLSLKRITKKLKIKRIVQKSARENENIKINYEISNFSKFKLTNYIIEENFEGNDQFSWVITTNKKIRAESRIKIGQKLKLNNGMGKKAFQDLQLTCWDPLGIFTFNIIFNFNQSIEVYPTIKSFEHDWDTAGDSTTMYGLHELNKKGEANNFIGIKKYSQGDPLRYINWLVSQRNNEIYTNQFDQLINGETTLLLNNLRKYHIGKGKKSSLENIRKLALTIALEQLTNGNRLRLLTSGDTFPYTKGKEAYHFLEKYICELDFCEKSNLNIKNINFNKKESIIYLLPLHPYTELDEEIEYLIKLSSNNFKVLIIFIDSFVYYSNKLNKDSIHLVKGISEATYKKKEIIYNKLKKTSIFHYTLDISNNTFEKSTINLIQSHKLFQDAYYE